MEIYEPGTGQKTPHRPQHHSNEERVFFKRSAFNDWTPRWEKIAFFCLGFFGLDLISLVTSFIIGLTPLVETNYVRAMSLNNFLAYLFLFGAFLAFLFFDGRKSWKRLFEDFKDPHFLAYGAAGLLGIYGINILFNLLYSLVPFYGDNENQLLIESCIKNDPVLMFFSVSIFAPFVEEFTYRIGLVDSIGHKRRWLGVLLSSVIFGAIHFDWPSLFSYIIGGAESGIEPEAILNELMNLPVYIGSGVVLGFVYALSGKISSSLFAHALNNTISFVVLLA